MAGPCQEFRPVWRAGLDSSGLDAFSGFEPKPSLALPIELYIVLLAPPMNRQEIDCWRGWSDVSDGEVVASHPSSSP